MLIFVPEFGQNERRKKHKLLKYSDKFLAVDGDFSNGPKRYFLLQQVKFRYL